jgi:hypothetical protein
MLKKILWLTIIVLAVACIIYLTNGNGFAPAEPNLGTPTIVLTTEVPTLQMATVTPTVVSATATSPGSPTKTTTRTPAPTVTSTIVPSATPTFTKTVTVAPTATASFQIQTGSPAYMANFAHPDSGCGWQGVAGQVFDRDGAPIPNYVVKVSGIYAGKTVNLVALTGMSAGKPYGIYGYEIVLGTQALISTNSLIIQVFDSNGVSITDPLKFNTYADCQKNLIIINFVPK